MNFFASSIHVTGWESRCVIVSIRTNHHHSQILHKNSFFKNKFQINNKLMRIQVDWRMESKVMMKREKVRIDSVDLWTMEVRVKELEAQVSSKAVRVQSWVFSLSLSAWSSRLVDEEILKGNHPTLDEDSLSSLSIPTFIHSPLPLSDRGLINCPFQNQTPILKTGPWIQVPKKRKKVSTKHE